jgi:hypothetical protein
MNRASIMMMNSVRELRFKNNIEDKNDVSSKYIFYLF